MSKDDLEKLVDACGATFFVVNFEALAEVAAFPDEILEQEIENPAAFYGALSYKESGNPLRIKAAKKIFDANAQFDAIRICSESSATKMSTNELRISGEEVIANAERILRENGMD